MYPMTPVHWCKEIICVQNVSFDPCAGGMAGRYAARRDHDRQQPGAPVAGQAERRGLRMRGRQYYRRGHQRHHLSGRQM